MQPQMAELEYPESDGKPMFEDTRQAFWVIQGGRLTLLPVVGNFDSPLLGIRFVLRAGRMLVQDAAGQPFRTLHEERAHRERAEAQVRQERTGRGATEERAKQERADREAAKARVDREAAEARTERLLARLRALGLEE